MSTMCGIVRVDAAVHEPEIDAMLAALDHWHADARGRWASGHAGLGHLLLRTTAQSAHEQLPARDDARGLALTGDLRLDNREELAGRLAIPSTDLGNWSDGRLLLRAYGEWGDGCAARLLGDFAFAVWDAPKRRLFCARDPFGIKPFYYVHGRDVFAFATEMKGLLALPFVDRSIDEVWIGDYLHRLPLDGTSTLYRSIRRLKPGHTLAFDGSGLRFRQYWSLDTTRELHLASDADYVEAFREKLTLAIRRRTDSPCEVGAELSGGLDSSAISAIAHHALHERGRALWTFSQVRPPGMPELPGLPPDWRWAVESVCRFAGITRTCYLAGEGGVLEALDWANAHHDEPSRDPSSFSNHGLYEAASSAGVNVLLSGFGGNHCVSAGGGRRRQELLWGGHWIELSRELAAERRSSVVIAWLKLLLREIDRPALDVLLRRSITWQAHPTRPTTDAFARRIGITRRTRQAARLRTPSGRLREHMLRQLQAPGVTGRLDYANVATSARRIEYRYPLLDAELVAFHLSLPSRLKYRRGTGRYIFRQSLEGLVPDDVRLSTAPRGSSNPGNLTRKQRDEAALKTRLDSLGAGHPVFDYLDLDKLRQAPRVRGRMPRERHSDMIMALALANRLEALAKTQGGAKT